jgi:hypothetical protein
VYDSFAYDQSDIAVEMKFPSYSRQGRTTANEQIVEPRIEGKFSTRE